MWSLSASAAAMNFVSKWINNILVTWLFGISKRHNSSLRLQILIWPVFNSRYEFIFFRKQSRSKCLPQDQHQLNGQHGHITISTTKPDTQRKSFENAIYLRTNNNSTKADYLLSQTNQLYSTPITYKSTPEFFMMGPMMDSFSSACHHQTSMDAITNTTGEETLNTPSVEGMLIHFFCSLRLRIVTVSLLEIESKNRSFYLFKFMIIVQ